MRPGMSFYFVWKRSSATIDFMRRLLLLWVLSASFLFAQDKPLTSLPYTPSLDTTFMDKTADPCTNFYRYACGNWNKLNPIPADQARWDVYGKLANENERLLWGILQAAAKPSASRTPNEQKIGTSSVPVWMRRRWSATVPSRLSRPWSVSPS